MRCAEARNSVVALLLAVASGAAVAQAAGGNAVTVTADEGEWLENSRMVYRGNVRLESSTLSLTGDNLTLDQPTSQPLKARVEGSPATLQHSGGAQVDGDTTPPVTARADVLNYDAASGWVTLEGQARLTRGKDSIDGETIRYNLIERRVQARSNGNGGQVRIVIQPPAGAALPTGVTLPTPSPSPDPSLSPSPSPDPSSEAEARP